MNALTIAFVTPEAVPFAKTGGLADVSGILPRLFAASGHSVRLFLPLYHKIRLDFADLQPLELQLTGRVGSRSYEGRLYHYHDALSGLDTYFVGNALFFDRDELYRDPQTGLDYTDNSDRFIFFSRAVLDALRKLDRPPDIIHANDWQAALVASFLRTNHTGDDFFGKSRSVLTIHNMAYQGQFSADTASRLGIDSAFLQPAGPFEYWGKINFLKSAIQFADKITTVSPTYAREIQQSNEFGMGLEGVLKERAADLVGILNGVDYNVWSPKNDPKIPYRYTPANLSGKKRNKLELLHRVGLPLRTEQPLIGMITRLDNQKGLDIIAEVIDDILGLPLQMVFLGTGAEEYHRLLTQAEKKHPDKIKAFLTFDDNLAHLIEAGADIFLMPSRFEPCGLNQMYSLKYGTVPIVRKTGGLADTVIDFNDQTGQGTGFVVEKYDSGELLATVERAVRLFRRRKVWYRIIKQAMNQDFSWDISARRYMELYQSVINRNT
ncbi:MAG: glycogen synthase GlgA [Candidatus Zixiibacteriota bacterium]|nr:MAG: glycogen synthase GlgA [candidate division Zixibacteria bacterium]